MDASIYKFSKVSEDALEIGKPIFVIIELTTKCNWRCKHCYLPSHNGLSLTLEDFKKLFKELRDFGIHQIAFTGGELFMRADALEIIELAREHYFRVNILSNASLLTESIVRRLAEIHITDYSSTIFSLDENVHDGITGVRGSLESALNGIKLLDKYHINIELKSPILKQNRTSFVGVYRFCKQKGYQFMSSPCIFTKINGDITPLSYALDGDDLEQACEKSDKLKGYELKKYITKLMCELLTTGFAINYKGDVYPCNSLFKEMGNIKQEGIDKIWNKESYKSIRMMSNKNLKYCFDCKLLPFCDRCPATLFAEGKDYYSCSNISKNIATARWNNFKKEMSV